MIDYAKGGNEAFAAWVAWKATNPNVTMSVMSFLAGWNAAQNNLVSKPMVAIYNPPKAA